MKRQRNIQQVKEHDKCPPNQTKEEEIGSLPEKEFRIMIVWIQNNDSINDPKSWKQNGVTDKQTRDKDWEDGKQCLTKT